MTINLKFGAVPVITVVKKLDEKHSANRYLFIDFTKVNCIPGQLFLA